MCALKRALSLALTDRAEESPPHAESRGNVLPSKLGDKEDPKVHNNNEGAVADNAIEAAAAVAATRVEQQPIHFHGQDKTLPVCLQEASTTEREAFCSGVEAERSTYNSARANSTERAGSITIADQDGGQIGRDDTDVRRHITVVHAGSGGAPGEHKAAGGESTVEADGQRFSGEDTVELLQHPTLGPAALRPAELSQQTVRADICTLSRDLAEARETAVTATECRRVAEARVVELKGIIAESERQHALFRTRGEARLEVLKKAFAQEQEEEGAQVRPPIVYYLKSFNQYRILENITHYAEYTGLVGAPATVAVIACHKSSVRPITGFQRETREVEVNHTAQVGGYS